MLSDKYSRFAIASLLSRISPSIRASMAANGLFSSGEGRARPARLLINATTPPNTSTPTRREFIRSPSLVEIELSRSRAVLPRHRDNPLIPRLVARHCPKKFDASVLFALAPGTSGLSAGATWRRLTLRAKIAASAGDDHTPTRRGAPVATLPFSPVGSMPSLILPRLAIRVKEIGNGRTPHHDRLFQNIL